MKRNIQNVDDDIIRKKRIVEQALYSDSDIVEVLDDPDVDPSCPEELLYRSIWPFIRIPGVQDTAKNYITFSISDMGLSPRNEVMKNQYVQFVIFVHKTMATTNFGMARHDCLGYLIRDIFNLSNMLGAQMNLVSNIEGVTDTDYLTRTLKFELVDDNSTKPLRTNPYDYRR
jgi:hypothetical protein